MRQPLKFGKYLLLERISVGGMAEVFKAKSYGVEGFEKIIAIKRILPSMAEDADFITMFIDEARIGGQLNHPHVAQIYELSRVGDSHFIAMEYVWGKDVLQMQNRFRRLKSTMPFPMAAFVASKMCEALDYAHKKRGAMGNPLSIIHRDISPQNIIVSYEGDVKLIDFGIAKAASRSSKTQAGVLKGKFGYMSPEQVRGLPLDRRSDIFAIGTILYELMSGERLFLGESDFSTLEKVRHAEVPPLSRHNREVPPALEKIVMKTLARAPEDRYQWASELNDALVGFCRQADAAYGGEKLGRWMKDAFASELTRERLLLEQYKNMDLAGAPAAAPQDLFGGRPEVTAPERNVARVAGGSLEARPEEARSLLGNPSHPNPIEERARRVTRPPGAGPASGQIPAQGRKPPQLPQKPKPSVDLVAAVAELDPDWDLETRRSGGGEKTQISDPLFPLMDAEPEPVARRRSGGGSVEFDDSPTEIFDDAPGAVPVAAAPVPTAPSRKPSPLAPQGAYPASLNLPSESTYILPGNQHASPPQMPLMAPPSAPVALGPYVRTAQQMPAVAPPPEPPKVMYSPSGQLPAQAPPQLQQPALQQQMQQVPQMPAMLPQMPAMQPQRPQMPQMPALGPMASGSGGGPAVGQPDLSATGLVYSPPVSFSPGGMAAYVPPPDLVSGYTPPPFTGNPAALPALVPAKPRPIGPDLAIAGLVAALALGAMFGVKQLFFGSKRAPSGQIAVIAGGQDATLLLDAQVLGTVKANVPMKIADVAAGGHEVIVRWAAGVEFRRKLELAADASEVVMAMPPGTGSVGGPQGGALTAVAEGKPPADKLAADKAAADKLAADKAAADKLAADKAAADKLAADKAATDKAATDKVTAELEAQKLANAKAVAVNQAAADKAAADLQAEEARLTEKAAAERKLAEARKADKHPADSSSAEDKRAAAEAKQAARAEAAAKKKAAAEAKAAEKKAAAEAKTAEKKAAAEAKAAEKKAAADKADKADKTAASDKPGNGKDAKDPNAAKGDVGYLIANTEPWARVYIDGKDTGMMTPIAPRAKIALKPGKHTVMFVIDKSKFKYPIVIEAGADYRLIKTLDVGEATP